MQISLLHSLTRRVSVTAITGYQKHISPYKGFVCAHRILHGGESCSQYIKRVIAQEGLRIAFIKSRTRFQACKQANLILHSQSHNSGASASEDEADIQQPKKENGSNDLSCGDWADLACNCPEFMSEIAACGATDCSVLDCSGADCSFLDCGSCGS
ncbi:membrane protein insertion efficiency factor YidD [Nostoc sp. CHAB 5844]|nr:membrane protein insertion efficiency factor YidD [Nostoc sp. CHAB 5844]